MVRFCVVNCCFCKTFQGQQVKKDKRWTCKMCGEKQSFRKIFFQGGGKECRHYVQNLNIMRGTVQQQQTGYDAEQKAGVRDRIEQIKDEECPESTLSDSKWKQFATTEPEFQDDGSGDEDGIYTTERATFNRYKSQKRKKTNSQTALQDLSRYPRKIQKVNDATVKPSSSAGLSCNAEKLDKHPVEYDVKGHGIENELPVNHYDHGGKEHELCISSKNLSFNHSNKTSDYGQAKTSKWSKYISSKYVQ